MVKPVKKPVVSNEEQKFRDELYPDVRTVKNKNILCTSCNGSLKELILKGKPITHPFMDTLLCEKCNSFFGDGEFSVDEDGSDKYCRWCGQGGTLYLCSKCTAGFCKKCIKRNLPRAALKEVEDDDWKCFCCNVKPLYELRAHCWAAKKFAAEYVKNEEGKRRKGKKSEDLDNESQSDNSNDSVGPRKRRNADDSDKEDEPTSRKSSRRTRKPYAEETKTKAAGKNKSNEKTKLYKPVVSKLTATLKDGINMTELFKKKALDCINKKISLNYIKDNESVIQVCGKVEILLQSVEKISHDLKTSVTEYLEDWKKEHVESVDKNESNDKMEEDEEQNDKMEEDEPDDKNNESNDKMEDDADDKKTVNGIEDEKKLRDEDKLGNKSKRIDDASDESEHSKKSSDQEDDKDISADKTKNGSDSETSDQEGHSKNDDGDDDDEDEDEKSKDDAFNNLLKNKADDSKSSPHINEKSSKDDDAFNKLLENKADVSESSHKNDKYQKDDSDDEIDKKNETMDDSPSKSKRAHESSEEDDDIPAEEKTPSSKKLKIDHGDGEN